MKKFLNNISSILLWLVIIFVFGCLFFYADEVSEKNKKIIATVEGHIDDYTAVNGSGRDRGYHISNIIYTYIYDNKEYTQQENIDAIFSSSFDDKILVDKLSNIDVYIVKKTNGNIYATINKPVMLSQETVLSSKIIIICILLVVIIAKIYGHNIRKSYKTNNLCNENNNYNDDYNDDEILPKKEREKINEIIEKLNKDKNKLRYSTESLDYTQNMEIATDISNIIEVVKKLQNYIDNYE